MTPRRAVHFITKICEIKHRGSSSANVRHRDRRPTSPPMAGGFASQKRSADSIGAGTFAAVGHILPPS